MSSLKRAADTDAEATENAPDAYAASSSPDVPYVAAPAPSHLFVVVADVEYDAGLDCEHDGPRPLGVARTLAGATALMKNLHDAHEAARVLKDGDAVVEFAGLDANPWRAKGKLVGEARVGAMQARVEKWKVASGKTLATGAKFVEADAAASAPETTVHYAYTIVYTWADYCGDFGGHTLGGVALRPSCVPALVSKKLPSKGSAAMNFPAAGAKDGVLVAEDSESKGHKGKRHLGVARRWIVRDWDADEGKKAPARKKAKTA
ncbi:hypothetical protein B0H15DRAFT_953148 [Mycena belliarum]|uniref:Uncharacterized protein n=1 Tax=Mycena belliarum TaxID=1033014 RepID=A0AAD6TXQ5_9AGAR|nr:hypothetical protein B0H15DRAFT_953148 [Mycena belliae]